MIEDLKYAFSEKVESLSWMDGTTRSKALSKLYSMRTFLGYPTWIMNVTQLDKHYRDVSILINSIL